MHVTISWGNKGGGRRSFKAFEEGGKVKRGHTCWAGKDLCVFIGEDAVR